MVEAKGPEGVEALPAIGKYIDPVISTLCARWLAKLPFVSLCAIASLSF